MFLQRAIIVLFEISTGRKFLTGGGAGRVAYAEQSMVESKKRHRDTMRALGEKNSPDILKAFT